MTASAEVLPAASPASGELLAAPGSLLAAGERVARRASAPSTRSTYLHAYRHFAGFLAARLGRAPEPTDLTEAALLDFRDGLEAAGRAWATVAKELSALRRLPRRSSQRASTRFVRQPPRQAIACRAMPMTALTSAEISLPGAPEALRVRERIAALADTVDIVGLTDNHAGQARMSPLAAVALAREQGVATVVHVSCRDRNRLALQSQVVGAAALGSEGILCLQGDPVDGVQRVKDLTATALIAEAHGWAAPRELAVGAVVNPFAADVDREVRLLERKLAAGATFVQSQMCFDLDALRAFLERAGDLLDRVRFYAGVALLRNDRMADHVRALPGCVLPDAAHRQISLGGGLELATELAVELAAIEGVDALHLFPLGGEASIREIAVAYRTASGVPAQPP
jgi:methylenetetrahydrofolate reductase (NADPH)